MNDNLVPEPRHTVFDSVQKALGDEQDVYKRQVLC